MVESVAALPLAPGALPLIGHLLPLARDPLGFVADSRRTGPVVRLQLGPRPLVMVYDPALVRHVLLNPRTFDKHGPMWQRAPAKSPEVAWPAAPIRSTSGCGPWSSPPFTPPRSPPTPRG